MHQKTLELNCSRTALALDSTLVVAVEMSLSTWLVCAEVPGLERRAMKKMSVCTYEGVQNGKIFMRVSLSA